MVPAEHTFDSTVVPCGTRVRTYVRIQAYMLADIVVAIPAGDLAVEAAV
jgi:hypothetical protein